jgi:hypothetical protein
MKPNSDDWTLQVSCALIEEAMEDQITELEKNIDRLGIADEERVKTKVLNQRKELLRFVKLFHQSRGPTKECPVDTLLNKADIEKFFCSVERFEKFALRQKGASV